MSAHRATEQMETLRAIARKTESLSFPQSSSRSQTTDHILMVAPLDFSQNMMTVVDNTYMKENKALTADQIREKAAAEFLGLYSAIAKAGINVHLFTQETEHNTPDACFPNNWFSTHSMPETGDQRTMLLYPMKAPNRRLERRADIIAHLRPHYDKLVDLSDHENAGRFFEGTGTLVIDRVNKVAYVLLSERAHLSVAQEWAKCLGYRLVAFHAYDQHGKAIYHTNVMMAVGTKVAVVCTECVTDPEERKQLLDALHATHSVIQITSNQVNHFCGNVIEVHSADGSSNMVMSSAAYNGFTEEQRARMLQHVDRIVHADISLIEELGGGSVRCTIAEIF